MTNHLQFLGTLNELYVRTLQQLRLQSQQKHDRGFSHTDSAEQEVKLAFLTRSRLHTGIMGLEWLAAKKKKRKERKKTGCAGHVM